MNKISAEQYLRSSDHPVVSDALGRYDRGDIDYIQALERIAVVLLGNAEPVKRDMAQVRFK